MRRSIDAAMRPPAICAGRTSGAASATKANMTAVAVFLLRPSSDGKDGAASMADDDMRAELERLRAENERLKNRGARGVSLKVSEKGGVSVYGLGRFPVTLYKEQWTRLLDMADDIRAFIKDNDSKLKAKGE